MIPYFQYTVIYLGPVPIQVWGLMVALGIMAATLLANHLAKKHLLAPALTLDLIIWALVGAFVGARLFHVVFYNAAYYLRFPGEILKIWHGGLSSLGGFVGALMASYLFAKRRRLSLKEFLPYADILSVSLWLGWGIGRIGCFLIHDHPGTLSDFILSVKYPGGARHDLGLYESILGFVLFAIFFLLFKKLIKRQWGLVTAYSWLSYAVARFGLDWLRATDLPLSDARYAALTPAQWGMVALTAGLISWLIFGRMKRAKITTT